MIKSRGVSLFLLEKDDSFHARHVEQVGQKLMPVRSSLGLHLFNGLNKLFKVS